MSKPTSEFWYLVGLGVLFLIGLDVLIFLIMSGTALMTWVESLGPCPV